MASPKSEMSFSSASVEPCSRQPSPGSDLQSGDPMECDVGDNYVPDIYPSEGMESTFEPMNLVEYHLESLRRLEEARAEIARLEKVMVENGIRYSDFGMDYSAVGHDSGTDPGDGLYSEIDGDAAFVDAELSDMPPLLEPLDEGYDPEAVSAFLAAGMGKGREVDSEVGNELGEGRKLDKGKGKTKGKGKARAGPYPRDRTHLRTTFGMGLQPSFPQPFLTIGGCSDDSVGDLLAGLRTRSLLSSDNHFSGDPSGCGIPHHDDD